MRMVVCSVYDKSVGAYMTPFFVRSKGEGIRSWTDAVGDSNMPFGRHAQDFTLMFIGYWDDSDGSFEVQSQGPVPLISALECQALKVSGEGVSGQGIKGSR